MSHKGTPLLTTAEAVDSLKPRIAAYWNTLEFGRHIGVQKHPNGSAYWVARYRKPTGGRYAQKRLALVSFDQDREGIDYISALRIAKNWFASPRAMQEASPSYPLGVNRTLKYQKQNSGFTVGDALADYVEWKRIAAAKSHFETNLSLINHHIVPRLGDVLLDEFTGKHLTAFCFDVMQTPPKRGHKPMGRKIALSDMSEEQLRKRKKTVNTLIGILRMAFRMAWENGETDSERAWRCLRRLPHSDVPRHIFLTRSQCRLLLNACREDLKQLVLGALYSGCRVTELSRLRVRDVGGHFFGLYVAPLKSSRARYVHLPEEGMSFFLDQCEGRPDNDLVFRMRSNRHWSGGHKHLFRQAVIDAGLPDTLVFHGLRHTYASQLVQAGTPLSVVAHQLGHTTTDTVSRTYGHLCCSTIEEELSRRFAPIHPTKTDVRLEKLREGLQDQHLPSTSWPLHNNSSSSDALVKKLRQLAGT